MKSIWFDSSGKVKIWLMMNQIIDMRDKKRSKTEPVVLIIIQLKWAYEVNGRLLSLKHFIAMSFNLLHTIEAHRVFLVTAQQIYN